MMKKIISILIISIFLCSLTSCGHEHSYTEEVIKATCSQKGYTLYKCECGESYKDHYTDILDHEYDNGVITIQPTESMEGLKVKTCKVCGEKIEEVIPSITHTHSYQEEIILPSCTKLGYTLYTCSCGETYQDNYVDKIDHAYGDFVVTSEPTIDSFGQKEKTCKACGNKVTEAIPALNHTHEYLAEIVKPTCLNKGYTQHTCKCGDTYQDNYVDKLTHEYTEEVTLPTCLSTGYTIFTCKLCDDSYVDNFTPISDHHYGDWEIVKTPTSGETGLQERVCVDCKTKQTEVIPVIDTPAEVQITYDLNGGLFNTGYTTIDALSSDFLNDYNQYGDTSATIANFLKDSTSSVKVSLSNSTMLKKWQWLFTYMYNDVKAYNTTNGTLSINFVADSLDLFPKLISLDTAVIKDSSKGPNFRTLVRSYLHGMMNNSQGDPVGNATFALYVPDFGLEENRYQLLLNQYDLSTTFKRGDSLPTPIKENHKFVGWADESGNIITIPTKDLTLKAVWEEGTPVENIKITNKITELDLYDTYQLTWEITPSNAVNKKVRFESSDESIVKVDNNGLITGYKAGTAMIKIISLALSGKTDSFTINVVQPGYFDISYNTTSYVAVDSVIKLNAVYYNAFGKKEDVKWESLNKDIALVDGDGAVTGLKEGKAYIRAVSIANSKKYQDFMVTVVSKEISDGLQVALDAHVSNVFVEYNLGIGAGTPVYYTDIIGSVSKLLYNEDLVINNTYNQATNNKYGEELKNRLLESVEFITVHYTGSMASGDTAEAIAKYFAKPLTSVKTSIHYSTGNDGIFRGMDEIYRAAHAGDDGSLDTVAKFSWLDTPVSVLPTDPEFPVVTITKNSTFAINGRDTLIKTPVETKFGRGYVTDSKWLNEMGLAVNVKDGKYQLGTSWWCYTQVWEGRICSNGGNRNSIGIESCVNKGSDLWYTWQKTAMLCADIMYRYNLDITRVKGHHFFSAKNCPQPMLENDLEIWWEFIDLVKAEYAKITKASGYHFAFSSTSDYLNNKGRVLKQDNTPQLVTYTVTISKNGQTETVELASIIEGKF